MAQVNNKPVLSLCIPIYNRLAYLERQLKRFLEDKILFEDKIQLIISDNCSEDDLSSCCQKYVDKGLNIIYHRNETNIGPDGNFEWCFYHAEGKYVWLLGSDDIPVKGFLIKLVYYLENGDYGLFHLSMRKREQELTLFNISDEMAVAVNYWITFMSSNIIKTDSLNTVNLNEYRDSFLIQVPAYLNACFFSSNNAVLSCGRPFEKDSDVENNGGFNFLQVFVVNLFGIYETFINKGLLSRCSFERIKKIEYKEHLAGYICKRLLFRQTNYYKSKESWKAFWKYYWSHFYTYYYIVDRLISALIRRVVSN